MFMVTENKSQKDRLEKLYKKVKFLYGNIPPQMQFIGNIDASYLEDFLQSLLRIVKHPHINPDWFGFVRLHIAFTEDYDYCKGFNTALLLSCGYTQEQLDQAVADISIIPFDEKHRTLAEYTRKVIYKSKYCTQEDLKTLYEMGWSQKDVFDGVEHAGTLFRNGRILTAYSIKD